jgi:hypothetical protein
MISIAWIADDCTKTPRRLLHPIVNSRRQTQNDCIDCRQLHQPPNAAGGRSAAARAPHSAATPEEAVVGTPSPHPGITVGLTPTQRRHYTPSEQSIGNQHRRQTNALARWGGGQVEGFRILALSRANYRIHTDLIGLSRTECGRIVTAPQEGRAYPVADSWRIPATWHSVAPSPTCSGGARQYGIRRISNPPMHLRGSLAIGGTGQRTGCRADRYNAPLAGDGLPPGSRWRRSWGRDGVADGEPGRCEAGS